MGSPQLQSEGAGEGKEAARGEATEKDMTLGVQPRQNRYQNQKLWGRTREAASLTNSQGLLMLLIWGPHSP